MEKIDSLDKQILEIISQNRREFLSKMSLPNVVYRVLPSISAYSVLLI